MLAFIKTWLKQIKYKDLWQEAIEILHCDPNLTQKLGYGSALGDMDLGSGHGNKL